MRILLLMMALMLVVMLCCSDKCPTESDAEIGPPSLVFGRTYINWAWGYRHHGWYIDSTGTVNSFQYTADDGMWDIEEDTLITLDELARIDRLSIPTGRVIPEDTLSQMLVLVGPASEVGEPEPWRCCEDCGIWKYVAYIWDDECSAYRILTLFQAGDYAYKNESPEGRVIYEWLGSIDGMDTSLPCSPGESRSGILFGKTYINWAWGYRHHGWYIDSTGTVSSFRYSINDSMWSVEEDTLITLGELSKIQSLSTRTARVIPRDSLAQMSTLIGPVAQAPAPQPEKRCYDFGVIKYVAYAWDDDRSGYRILTLYQAGDYASKHELPEAVVLYKWLMLSVDGIDSLRWCAP